MTLKMRMKDGSGEITLKHVSEDVDRHGNVRIYVRRPGKPKVRLTSPIGTQTFLKEYRAALTDKPAVRSPKRPQPLARSTAPTSLRWLVEQYYRARAFTGLGKITQYQRRRTLDRLCDKDGDKPFKLLQRKHVLKIRDRMAETPAMANQTLVALRGVYKWALDYEHVDANPVQDIKPISMPGDGFHSWTMEEIAAFEERHPIGTKARLALALLLYTAQRRSDVIRMGPAMVNGEWLTLTQYKNRERKPITLSIPFSPGFKTIIDASPCGTETWLTMDSGKPFTTNWFSVWFRERCDEAGLPHCSAHGLRKAAASMLAERGATESQIRSITGHTTTKEVDRYTKAARQKELASSISGFLVPLSTVKEAGGTKPPPNHMITKEKNSVQYSRS